MQRLGEAKPYVRERTFRTLISVCLAIIYLWKWKCNLSKLWRMPPKSAVYSNILCYIMLSWDLSMLVYWVGPHQRDRHFLRKNCRMYPLQTEWWSLWTVALLKWGLMMIRPPSDKIPQKHDDMGDKWYAIMKYNENHVIMISLVIHQSSTNCREICLKNLACRTSSHLRGHSEGHHLIEAPGIFDTCRLARRLPKRWDDPWSIRRKVMRGIPVWTENKNMKTIWWQVP